MPKPTSPPKPLGQVDSAQINEASGLSTSRINNEIFYTHNDSGDSARLFALDRSAHLVAILNLSGISAIDYEDMAIGPGPVPDTNYIYLGDIGDNDARRKSITVYRFTEPRIALDEIPPPTDEKPNTPKTITIDEIDSLQLRYEDGPRNAEALMVDPLTGDLFIATKQIGTTTIYVARSDTLKPDTTITLHPIATVQLGGLHMITAGDISPDGTLIALRSYSTAVAWTRNVSDEQTSITSEIWNQTPHHLTIADEPQGEAFSFDPANAGYYTLSEGINQPLYYYECVKSDEDSHVPCTEGATHNSPGQRPGEGEHQSTKALKGRSKGHPSM